MYASCPISGKRFCVRAVRNGTFFFTLRPPLDQRTVPRLEQDEIEKSIIGKRIFFVLIVQGRFDDSNVLSRDFFANCILNKLYVSLCLVPPGLDFFLGARVIINTHQFLITSTDERSLKYMEENAAQFSMSNIDVVMANLRSMLV